MIGENQPRASRFNNNEVKTINNKEFFSKIKENLEKQVDTYSGDPRQLMEIQTTMSKCYDLCKDLQIRDRVVIQDPPLKNVVSREIQCDAPIADLNIAPVANN